MGAANDRDYGQESIEILLNVMENNKEDLIVVMAGYADRMESFYNNIPGLNSRIGNHIEFPDYSADELTTIGEVMCRDLEYKMAPGAPEALTTYMTMRKEMPFFANARTVRNAIDLARMKSAIRIFNERTAPGSDGMVTEDDLQTIQPVDMPFFANARTVRNASSDRRAGVLTTSLAEVHAEVHALDRPR